MDTNKNIETIRTIIKSIVPTLEMEANVDHVGKQGEMGTENDFSYTQQRAMINQIFRMTSRDKYNVSSIMLRLTVIDSLYSTNAQYSYFSIEEMAKKIKSLGNEDNAEEYFYSLVYKPDGTRDNDTNKQLFSKQYGIRKNCEHGSQQISLMSKYAYYVLLQKPEKYPLGFPIYDSLAIEMYPYVCKKIGLNNKSKASISNSIELYIEALNEVREEIFKEEKEGPFNGYQQYDLLDAYLWRMGKVNNGNYSLLFTRNEYEQFINNLGISNTENNEDYNKQLYDKFVNVEWKKNLINNTEEGSYDFNAIVQYLCATLRSEDIFDDGLQKCEGIKQLIEHWKDFYLLKIRPAIKKDYSEIAKIIQLAWPIESMLESTGLTKQEFDLKLEDIVKNTKTLYSFKNTYVAEYAEKIVGAMCAYDGAKYLKLKQPIVDMLGADTGFAQLKETEAGEFYLDSVGVLSEYRGRGIASRLFEAQCERAASLGHKVAGLIVDVDKPQAEALYARLGFRYLDDKDFFGHTMKHMIRNL